MALVLEVAFVLFYGMLVTMVLVSLLVTSMGKSIRIIGY